MDQSILFIKRFFFFESPKPAHFRPFFGKNSSGLGCCVPTLELFFGTKKLWRFIFGIMTVSTFSFFFPVSATEIGLCVFPVSNMLRSRSPPSWRIKFSEMSGAKDFALKGRYLERVAECCSHLEASGGSPEDGALIAKHLAGYIFV